MAETIVPQSKAEHLAYQAILLFLTLKGLSRAALAGVGLVLILFVFSTIINAVAELGASIADTWHRSTCIEQLLILIVAFLCVRYAGPRLARLLKRGL
ncbi:hypothetical protein [Ktedonobacter racemifer]|uniref:Uncharacterized protein n=1 Tax=Ktedonobacter racemifer DSM 44963 TaxID=485913 RepID=D6U8Z4_KTERA|nr:hypothetical protein [Ktedonobacter racemifer]EFH79549.1 hypothetical protein Krac_0059 [Ktedonobacter racemifer DSM 44963]